MKTCGNWEKPVLVCAITALTMLMSGTTQVWGKGSVASQARKIDLLVEANYKTRKLRPNPMASDAVFLRRAYLSITGTIPNYQQTKAFLSSRDSKKRAKLIDSLLASDGYVSHSFNYFADLLRAKDRMNNNVPGRAYGNFIKQSLSTNKPYDQFVYELLSAEGRMTENGAAGYYVRDSGMPLDNTANTVRVFLGTQIGCAQCHDHPFDKWSQYEFYEMAAFTYGTQTRYRDRSMFRSVQTEIRKQKLSAQEQATVRRLLRFTTYRVFDNERRVIRLPDDYQYDDAKPKSVVKAATIFGEDAKITKGSSKREALARWVTSPKNPQFAKVIANRLWKRVMGVGLVEPVDDFRDDTKASNPALLEHLTQEMVRMKFDMKQFMRVLYNTRTYQRMATRYELKPGVAYHFQGPVLQRMSAEQLWDSMLTLAMPKPDGRKFGGRGGFAVGTLVEGKSPQEIITVAKQIADPAKRRELQRKARMEVFRNDAATYRAYPRTMYRASELRSPAPPGHFLQQFGQSDRELIENANTDPTVTQVLTLLNGPVYRVLMSRSSVLMKNIGLNQPSVRGQGNRRGGKGRNGRGISGRDSTRQTGGMSTQKRVEVLFLSVLNRYPTATEKSVAMREIQTGKTEGVSNVIWALMNTREFMFVQ